MVQIMRLSNLLHLKYILDKVKYTQEIPRMEVMNSGISGAISSTYDATRAYHIQTLNDFLGYQWNGMFISPSQRKP